MAQPTPYCTAADLEAVIGRDALLQAAADPDRDDVVDTDVVDRAITAVSSRIDGYIRSRYSLPLADVPEVLRRAAARLVHAELVAEGTTTEIIERRAADAVKLVEHIASGRLRIGGDLDGDSADANTASGNPRAHVAKRKLSYGRDSLRGVV